MGFKTNSSQRYDIPETQRSSASCCSTMSSLSESWCACWRRTQGRCVVQLVTGRRVPVCVHGDMTTTQLLQTLADHHALTDHKHFGVAFVSDTGENHWLHSEMRVVEVDVPASASSGVPVLHFLIRYYPETFRHLSDPLAVELLYQQVKNLIFKGELEAEEQTFRLAALALQAAHGDYQDDNSTRQLLRRTAVLPASVIKCHSSVADCEERVIEEYRVLAGTSRGSALVTYLGIAEKLASYGVHFYPVLDGGRVGCWLGISSRGIAHYCLDDRSCARRLFTWKHLENVTFRDKRFSIEVDEPKKVVHTLSSFNIYEEAISNRTTNNNNNNNNSSVSFDSDNTNDSVVATGNDELLTAISQPNTQVSVSRRTLGPGHISVYSWLAGSALACRNLWLTAVALHQFHIDAVKQNRCGGVLLSRLDELSACLSRDNSVRAGGGGDHCTVSSGSVTSLTSLGCSSQATTDCGQQDEEESEQTRAARREMNSALLARRQALESQLSERLQQLRQLCVREAELTGQLPAEMPLAPGEQPPVVRRRVGTRFTLPDALLERLCDTQEEMVATLEVDLEIQRRITTAALKLANDASLQKTIRKQRKLSYQMSAQKLKDIEVKLKAAKNKQKKPKQPRPSSDGEDHHTEDEDSVGSSDGGRYTQQYCNTLPSGRSHALCPAGAALSYQNTNVAAVDRTSCSSAAVNSIDDASVRYGAVRSAPTSPRLPSRHHHHHPSHHSHPQRQPPALQQSQYVSPARQSPHGVTPPPPPSADVLARFTQPAYSSGGASYGDGGYLANRVYTTRSSYRVKQYPTLSGISHACRVPPITGDQTDGVRRQTSCTPPVHHLSVDELDQDVTPLQASGATVRYGSLGRRRQQQQQQQRTTTAAWPPPPQPPRFTESPLSMACEVLRVASTASPSPVTNTGTLAPCHQHTAAGAHRACVGKKAWTETALDAAVDAADRTTVLATPAMVVPLEAMSCVRRGGGVRQAGGPQQRRAAVIAAESPVNETLIEAGQWQPYRESSKPFQMADFYKYSRRYRQVLNSHGTTTPTVVESPAGQEGGADVSCCRWSPGGSSSSSGCSSGGAELAASMTPPHASTRQPAGSMNSSFQLGVDSVADSFQSEMLNWYEAGAGPRLVAQSSPGGADNSQSRTATLV